MKKGDVTISAGAAILGAESAEQSSLPSWAAKLKPGRYRITVYRRRQIGALLAHVSVDDRLGCVPGVWLNGAYGDYGICRVGLDLLDIPLKVGRYKRWLKVTRIGDA